MSLKKRLRLFCEVWIMDRISTITTNLTSAWMRTHSAKSRHVISMHETHLGWNEDKKWRAAWNLGQPCSYFQHLICLFSEINAAHEVLLPADVSSCCSEPAVFYLLQNLLSRLMRLIKPVQSLFNEAPAAWSTEKGYCWENRPITSLRSKTFEWIFEKRV